MGAVYFTDLGCNNILYIKVEIKCRSLEEKKELQKQNMHS